MHGQRHRPSFRKPPCRSRRPHQARTVGSSPTTANYTAPANCPAPWSRVVLELSASVSDIQKDRIAAIWLNGAEILRTTTPFPMSPGVYWRVRKDVTRYTALLRGTSELAMMLEMMLENSNFTFPGVYSVNVSLHFYRGAVHQSHDEGRLNAHPTIRGLYREPADLIIPVSKTCGNVDGGFWFKVTNESDVQVAKITVPRNTYRAVLEVYVSHHDDDEYWYSNPLRTTTLAGHVGSGYGSKKPNGGFRQVWRWIDEICRLGSAVPVIYPGSINTSSGSSDGASGHRPSFYDLDLTPFVGQLVDGRPHEFGSPFATASHTGLVDANLHLWLDAWSDQVEGALVRYKVPTLRMSKQADWRNSDGKSEVEGQTIVRFSGWVSSSEGNTSTSIRHKIKFKSHIEVEDKGNTKNVEMESKARTTIRIERDHVVLRRVSVDTENPLQMMTMSSNGGGGTRIHKTKMSHEMMEMRSMTAGKGEF
ncbi:peptide-N4-(N-acetyl-beta-glucosaminyl)asparagine amidase A-like [Asparagus officinalis]|uniref:peptide-N4-(N-acetyl-beta- glucosaminyl)asparagine amidase A-like n=1 Tax=Asparagus officinalis TaxID=4686 RepID=UPI00098E7953|nr:peptide-N4-(N-acetyl-beta-glucosaminyl)asparagine amidase A-like [Asparagus officinalis]